jgi:hypothetical protein
VPSADFCDTIKINRFTLGHESVTCRRSPEVSSTAFNAQPPDLPPVSLMDMGFAIMCLLARHRRPPIRFLFIGSRLCSALLLGLALRRVLFHPCASLSLHVHHVVKRIYTSKLSNMSFRACGPRNLMKVVSVTALFSALRSRLSTLLGTHKSGRTLARPLNMATIHVRIETYCS